MKKTLAFLLTLTIGLSLCLCACDKLPADVSGTQAPLGTGEPFGTVVTSAPSSAEPLPDETPGQMEEKEDPNALNKNSYSVNIEQVKYDPNGGMKPTIVTSVEMFNELGLAPSVLDTASKTSLTAVQYNEDFFKSHILVVGDVTVKSGSDTVVVSSINATGDPITVTLKINKAEVGTSDMAAYRVFIDISIKEYSEQTSVVFDIEKQS